MQGGLARRGTDLARVRRNPLVCPPSTGFWRGADRKAGPESLSGCKNRAVTQALPSPVEMEMAANAFSTRAC